MKSLKRNGFQFPLLVAALSLSAGCVQAAGLGKITVLSPLGQPLRAEVDITASREELASMSARMAPSEAFKQVGIEYAPGLTAIRFSVDKRADGQSFLRLSTDRPVNEPFLDILVELTWSSGRMVREYTMLLDPPDVFTKLVTAPPTVAPQSASAEQPAAAAKTPVAATAAARPNADREKKPHGDGVTRKVSPGDTLTKVAAEVSPAGVVLDQMLVALFRHNEEAFAGGNMNRLRVGRVLAIPDAAAVAAIPAGEARATVIAQARDFNAYRQRLAGAVAAAPVREAEPAAKQRAEGKIAAKVEDKAAPAETGKDKLEVSRTESGKDVKAFQQRIATLEEDLIARDRSLKEASSRIAELEKNLGDLKKLAELKSQVGTQMQQQAEASKPVQPKPDSPAPAASTPEPPVVPPAPAKPVVKPPVQKPKPAVVAKPVAEPSFIDDNPSLVYGGGGLLALLLGWFGYSSWRRKRQEETMPPTTSRLNSGDLGANSVFGSTGGQAVDTGASIQTDFSQASIGAIDSDEGVDPVAEADVYMAYGRDAQAEEILVDALKNDPTRHAIHLKLLEIHAGRKNIKQFESLATEFYAQTGGTGPDWETAAAMGRTLDPDNQLYGGATTGRQVATAAAAVATMAASDIVLPATETEKLRATVILPGQLGQIAESARETSASQPATLDFDLDVGGGIADIEKTPDVRSSEPPPMAAGLDFDLDLPAAPSATVEPSHLDFDLALPEVAAMPPEPSPAVAPAMAAVPEIDFEFDIDAPSATVQAPPPKAPTFDLSSIDLELDGNPAERRDLPSGQVDEESPDVATKLELAQAYAEMGDKEGARELLQEVLHEGGSRQQQMARDRLAALGA